jgi:hypothetical protein
LVKTQGIRCHTELSCTAFSVDAGASALQATLGVRCYDGCSGPADLIRSQSGRRVTGMADFRDGTSLRRVFGYAAASCRRLRPEGIDGGRDWGKC